MSKRRLLSDCRKQIVGSLMTCRWNVTRTATEIADDLINELMATTVILGARNSLSDSKTNGNGPTNNNSAILKD